MSITPVTDSAIKQTYRMVDIVYCEDKALRDILISLELAYAAMVVRIKANIEQGREMTNKEIIDDFTYTFGVAIRSSIIRVIDTAITKINSKEV